MGFSRQEYWSGSPFPSPGDIPDPGIEPASPVLAGGFFTTEPLGKPKATVHGVAEPDTTEHVCVHCSPCWPDASWFFSPLFVHSPNIHRAVTVCSGSRTSCEHNLPGAWPAAGSSLQGAGSPVPEPVSLLSPPWLSPCCLLAGPSKCV